MMRSNIRWCSEGSKFTCWIGDVVSGAFIINTREREIVSWRVVLDAFISGSDIRDMMLEAVERRFGGYRTPNPVNMLSENGSCYIARETRIFARQLGLTPY